MSTYNIANFMELTDDNAHLNIWSASFNDMHRYVPRQATQVITPQYASNLPGLAADTLGSRYLWWVLLVYNGLYDPIEDVRPGVKLAIPEKASLVAYLQEKSSVRDSSNYRAALQPTLL